MLSWTADLAKSPLARQSVKAPTISPIATPEEAKEVVDIQSGQINPDTGHGLGNQHILGRGCPWMGYGPHSSDYPSRLAIDSAAGH